MTLRHSDELPVLMKKFKREYAEVKSEILHKINRNLTQYYLIKAYRFYGVIAFICVVFSGFVLFNILLFFKVNILVILLFALASYLLPVPLLFILNSVIILNREGRKLRQNLLQYKFYLQTTESGKLAFSNTTESKLQTYNIHLSYSVVLGLIKVLLKK